jgi:hypothetical protein
MGVALTVLKFLPFLMTTIQSVEGLFTKGADKKAAVMGVSNSILGSLVAGGVIDQTTATKFPDATSDLVDAIVKFNNATGVFVAPAVK